MLRHLDVCALLFLSAFFFEILTYERDTDCLKALSAFTDLYLAAYPAVVLWGLQMNIKKKVALCFALGIGSISAVVAIYKCTRIPSLAENDFTCKFIGAETV